MIGEEAHHTIIEQQLISFFFFSILSLEYINLSEHCSTIVFNRWSTSDLALNPSDSQHQSSIPRFGLRIFSIIKTDNLAIFINCPQEIFYFLFFNQQENCIMGTWEPDCPLNPCQNTQGVDSTGFILDNLAKPRMKCAHYKGCSHCLGRILGIIGRDPSVSKPPHFEC